MHILDKIKSLFSCEIDMYFDKLDKGMHTIVDKLDGIESKLEIEIYLLRKELDHYKSIIDTIGDTIPGMLCTVAVMLAGGKVWKEHTSGEVFKYKDYYIVIKDASLKESL